jgi:D-3-phosphoglycerate dehydrogenase
MKPLTIVTAEIVEPLLSQLKDRCDVRLMGWSEEAGKILTEDECVSAFRDAEILVVGYETLTERVLEHCPNLKLIAIPRGNPVNVSLPAANRRGIPVLYTPARNANAVAELVIGLTLSLIRRIARANHEIKNGRFLFPPAEDVYRVPEKDDIVWGFVQKDPSPFLEYYGYELYGKNFGLVGYGAIGRRVARFLQAMDVNVMAYDPYLPPETAKADGVELMSLDDLLRTSDAVSLHCKVTEETKGLIGAREIALMKPSAILINTARGVIVDQRALIEALEAGRIAGAALDVFWQEPLPENHPILKMDNVVITPHIGSASQDVPLHQSKMVVGDILAFLAGEPMRHVFNHKDLAHGLAP